MSYTYQMERDLYPGDEDCSVLNSDYCPECPLDECCFNPGNNTKKFDPMKCLDYLIPYHCINYCSYYDECNNPWKDSE